jgi:hypothetical protein
MVNDESSDGKKKIFVFVFVEPDKRRRRRKNYCNDREN